MIANNENKNLKDLYKQISRKTNIRIFKICFISTLIIATIMIMYVLGGDLNVMYDSDNKLTITIRYSFGFLILFLFLFYFAYLMASGYINEFYTTKLNLDELDIIKNSIEFKTHKEHFKLYFKEIDDLGYGKFIKAYNDLNVYIKQKEHKPTQQEEYEKKSAKARENFIGELKNEIYCINS